MESPRSRCAPGARSASCGAAVASRQRRALAQDAITLPRADEAAPIRVAADEAQHWQQGVYDVWHLRGNCRVRQGDDRDPRPRGGAVDRPRRSRTSRIAPAKVIAYFEGGSQQAVSLEHAATTANPRGDRLETPTWFGRLHDASATIDLKLPTPQPAPATAAADRRPRPGTLRSAVARRESSGRAGRRPSQQAQFTQAVPTPSPLVPAGAAPFRQRPRAAAERHRLPDQNAAIARRREHRRRQRRRERDHRRA